MGYTRRTRGKSSAIALTFAVILSYYFFFAAAGAVKLFSPALMTVLFWVPNVAGLAVAFWFLWRSETRLMVLPGPFGRTAWRK